jgi:hypothetical protein
MKGYLYQYNRNQDNNPYDDEDIKKIPIKLCPYNQDIKVSFGVYSHPEATGYFIVKGNIDIKQGDEIEFRGERHTVLEVKDNWIFNKIVNITILIK